MIQTLLDDIKAYFDAKEKLTEQEQLLRQRLSGGYFPITSVHRDDLQGVGFDVEKISDDDMKELARKMADDYCEQLFWSSMEIIAGDILGFPKVETKDVTCPECGSERVRYDLHESRFYCEACSRTWDDKLYVLVEFPEDTAFFEEEGIGYPAWNSEDNGARYVPEYDYIRHFRKTPAENSYYKPLRWPESQPYLSPNEPKEAIDALSEPINDEKGIADFGEQAVWVPLCIVK